MPYQIHVDSRGFETRPIVSHDFAIRAGRANISKYADSRFCPHWHEVPELTVILKGEMFYQVDDTVHHLKKGMGIYVNSNALHSGWNSVGECIYLPINFDPVVMLGGKDTRIYQKYVEPVMSSDAPSYIVFDPEKSEEDKVIIDTFTRIYSILKERQDMYELYVVSEFSNVWSLIAKKSREGFVNTVTKVSAKQMLKIKNAVDYIDRKYAEPINLTELSLVCGLTPAALCRSFKKIMRQTPMEYIARIRIYKSLPCLRSNEYSITEIAEMNGFSGSSYYAEVFKRYMSCTPSQYLKKSIESENN